MSDPLNVFAMLATWAFVWWNDRRNPLPNAWCVFLASMWATIAITTALTFGPTSTAVSEIAFAAWCAYLAWKRRKPRQRKPSKAAGFVRDLGHRLVVTSS